MSDDLPIGPDVAPASVHNDDRDELARIGVFLLTRREEDTGRVRIVEAKIVSRAPSVLVARVVVEYDHNRGGRGRATRAAIAMTALETGRAIGVLRIRSADLEALVSGLSSIVSFVESARARG